MKRFTKNNYMPRIPQITTLHPLGATWVSKVDSIAVSVFVVILVEFNKY